MLAIEQVSDHQVFWQGKILPCRVGSSGFSNMKKEGDGCTPTGMWKFETVYYRPDKVTVPNAALPVVAITPEMGWSDDPKDKYYNTCVNLPYELSHEKLWRDDNLYDLFITTSQNTNPIISGNGSAIFIHQMHENETPTAGCLALKFDDLLNLVKTATRETYWVVGDHLA